SLPRANARRVRRAFARNAAWHRRRPYSRIRASPFDSAPAALRSGLRSLGGREAFLFSNERQRFVAVLLHERLRIAFDVEPQQRLGVGGANVHPPVGIADRDPVEMIEDR